MQFDFIQKLFLWIIPLIFAITVHEVAHGWVASKRGDQTAKMLGRITLNPIKHIDLIGTIIIPIALLLLSHGRFTFGYAKPVPVNFRNLKNPRRDMALVAIAGPFANLIMALLWAVVAKVGIALQGHSPQLGMVLFAFGQAGIYINLVLGVLNLIPIPPLDGSRIVSAILPVRLAHHYERLERWGFLILILLLISGVLSFIIFPIVIALALLIAGVFGL